MPGDKHLQELEAKRATLSDVIACSFEYHCVIPGTLGTKAASVEHKCSTMLHALSLEVPQLRDVETLSNGIVALCTDMGMELALSEVTKSGFWKWLGREKGPERVHADAGSMSTCSGGEGLEGGDGHGEAAEAPRAVDTDEHLFSRCIPIPGCLHIFDNLLKTVHEAAKWWKPFERLLRAVCELLCKHAGIEQLQHTCIAGGPGQRHAELFEKPYPMFIEWRWSTVVKTLTWLMPLETPLREVWDEAKYLGPRSKRRRRRRGADPGPEDGDAVLADVGIPGDPADRREQERRAEKDTVGVVTEAIASHMFWQYSAMLWKLHHAIEKMVYWTEACACHPMPYDAEDKHLRGRRMRAWQKLMGPEFERRTLFRACPAEGKRAPELAAGEHVHMMSEQLDLIAAGVSRGMASLSEEDRTTLMADLQIARGLIEFGMNSKLGHWALIPWHLAGVLHHDNGVARACARSCCDQWDRSPIEKEHHRTSNLFLSSDSSFRPELEKFAEGAPWAEVSDELVCAIAPLRWVPVVERLIEGRHALINNRITGHKKRRHPTTVSLASGRLDEFLRRVQLRPEMMVEVASAMPHVRSFRKAAATFAFMDHPRIEPLWRREVPVHDHSWEPAVVEVFYRCDMESKHKDKAGLRKDIVAKRLAEARGAREADKRGHIERANTRACVLMDAMHEHLIRRCRQEGAGFMFAVANADVVVGMEARAAPGAIDPADQQPTDAVKISTVAGTMHCPRSAAIPRSSALRHHEGQGSLFRVDDGAESDSDEAPRVLRPPSLPASQDMLWCQVICANASKWKLVHVGAGVGRRLGSNDLVVSLHRHVPGVGMQANPMEVGSSGVDKVGILSTLDMKPELAERCMHSWERKRHVFTIEGSMCDMKAAEAVTALVSAGALASQGCDRGRQYLVVDGTETTVEQREIYRGLQEEGYTERGDDAPGGEQWALSAAGVANLKMVNCMSNPQRLFVPPHTRPALKDAAATATVNELISMLEAEGWTWRSLPMRLENRQALAFRLADEEPIKHWCTKKGVRTHASYLACLLHAPEVLGSVGQTTLEHGKGADYYARLLKGKSARPRRAALLDDGAAADEDMGILGVGSGADSIDEPDSCDSLSHLTEMLEDVLEDMLDEEQEQEARDRDSGAETPVAAETPLAFSEVASPQASSEAGMAVDADYDAEPRAEPELVPGEPDVPDAEVKAGASIRRYQLACDTPKNLNFNWGAFRMTLKKKKIAGGGFSWSWQCACPYHKKGPDSGCKKTLGMRFDTAVDAKERWDEECDATLLALKHWGNQALTKTTQDGHIWIDVIHDLAPPAAVVEAQKLMWKPRLPVLVGWQTPPPTQPPAHHRHHHRRHHHHHHHIYMYIYIYTYIY